MITRRIDLERLELHIKGAAASATPAALTALGRKVAEQLAERLGSAPVEPGALGRIEVRLPGPHVHPDRIASAVERRVRRTAAATRWGRS